MGCPLFKKTLLIFIVVVLKLCFYSDLCAQEEISLAILARYNAITMYERFEPLARYFLAEKGIPTKLVIADNFAHHISKVMKGEVHLCYQDPVVFLRLSKQVRPLAIAKKGSGGTKLRGIIITRTDSGIKSIDDLKNKTVSLVSMQSAGGYHSQKDYLRKRGIEVERDLIPSVAEENKQENVILDVFNKRSDVGFIRESALHIVDRAIDPRKIKVLAQTTWMPNWIFAAHKGLSTNTTLAIQDALLSLPSGSSVLRAAKLTGFAKQDDRILSELSITLKSQ